MKDLLKRGSTLLTLPIPVLGFVVSVGLLVDKVISFYEALILILIAVWIHHSTGSGPKVSKPIAKRPRKQSLRYVKHQTPKDLAFSSRRPAEHVASRSDG